MSVENENQQVNCLVTSYNATSGIAAGLTRKGCPSGVNNLHTTTSNTAVMAFMFERMRFVKFFYRVHGNALDVSHTIRLHDSVGNTIQGLSITVGAGLTGSFEVDGDGSDSVNIQYAFELVTLAGTGSVSRPVTQLDYLVVA